jgi:hypothetical protein
MPHHLRSKFEKKIQQVLTSGFEYQLLAAAFGNLEELGPLSFNNFSYALRELLRHVLHRLGTEDQVKACSWFKEDKTARGGITRAQRATYAIQGGLSDEFVLQKLRIDVKTVHKQLLQAIDTLSKYTHIEPDTFDISRTETDRLATECLLATLYFSQHIVICRTQVAEALAKHIDHHILNHVLSETIDSIDEIATHHWINEIYVNEIEVIEIGPQSIELAIDGTIGCELQYGSNSDVRNDIGGITSESFPLSAELTVQLVRPLGTQAIVKKFKVDTSGWYE